MTDLPPKKEIDVYAGMSKLQLGYADLIEKGTLRDTLLSQGMEQARALKQTNKMMIEGERTRNKKDTKGSANERPLIDSRQPTAS